jgi:uracil-DNA glycosylase family 4
MKLADRIAELRRIQKVMSACKKCALHENRDRACLGGRGLSNPPNYDIVLVLDRQTPEEIGEGHFGYGSNGDVLRELFRLLELDYSTFWITSLVACPTMPKNMIGEFGYELSPLPKKDEMLACRDRLHREIYLVDPVVVVAFGKPAFDALSLRPTDHSGNFGIMTEVMISGRITSYPIAVMPTHSLSTLARNPDMNIGGSWHQTFEHLQMAWNVAEELRKDGETDEADETGGA